MGRGLPRRTPDLKRWFIQIVAEGKTARIRTDENSFIPVMMKRDVIVPVLQDAGFDHVALDLEGVSAVRRGN